MAEKKKINKVPDRPTSHKSSEAKRKSPPPGRVPPRERSGQEPARPTQRPRSSKTPPRHRRASVILLALLTLGALLLIVLGVIGLVRASVEIDRFEIENDSVYTEREIVDATGLALGDGMFSVDREILEERILKALPYLRSVSVRRGLGGRLRIVTESHDGIYYTRISGEYYALNAELRVLHRTPSPEIYRRAGMLYLSFPSVERAVLGEVILFDSKRDPAYVGELMQALSESYLADSVRAVVIQSKYNISLFVEGKYEIVIGDSEDLPAKLSALSDVLGASVVVEAGGAKIDISDPKRTSVIPGKVETPVF